MSNQHEDKATKYRTTPQRIVIEAALTKIASDAIQVLPTSDVWIVTAKKDHSIMLNFSNGHDTVRNCTYHRKSGIIEQIGGSNFVFVDEAYQIITSHETQL